ncbi:MAG TPA: LD-carboxypeptidase [Saprospiraceae bacterium]|nr:LD-carboxypeptidase [Saprospiraceae bacterium]HMQ83455.1 LD-carboxypeptidase [Saprospiraceae bacterium]
MQKPKKLQPGDKIATISLSWGGAGELPHRYEAGKRQLESVFGLEVTETRHALKPADWIYNNPKARAEDLMEALQDSSIKAIISNIGGDDSIRLLKFIDIDIIRQHPKIFIGFSDTTVSHFCFYKAGVTSFYGTSTLVGFAENRGMHPYQIRDIQKTLFSASPVGKIAANYDGWTSEMLDWSNPENQSVARKLELHSGWRFLQGSGSVKGTLLGGCLEVLETLKDTDLWVQAQGWKGKIMFVEVSDFMLDPEYFGWIFRNYAASGILHHISGLLLGRPYHNQHWEAYDAALIKILKEEGLTDLPIITGMDFGHTCPTFTLPYGVMAEIDSEAKTFAIVESGVID